VSVKKGGEGEGERVGAPVWQLCVPLSEGALANLTEHMFWMVISTSLVSITRPPITNVADSSGTVAIITTTTIITTTRASKMLPSIHCIIKPIWIDSFNGDFRI
jgi:hypothetical protein